MTISSSPVDSTTAAKQMDLYNRIDGDIVDYYVSANTNGKDWKTISQKYKELIQKGLSQADFYLAMKQMVGELGDGSSYFLSPDEQASLSAAATNEFMDIGATYVSFNDPSQTNYVLNWVFPGGPADRAGLKSHDEILKVDGGAFLDAAGMPHTLGPDGSSVTVTVDTPGQAPREVKMVRSRVSGTAIVDDCLVPGTGIGYIRWEKISDPTVVDQTMDALTEMNGGSPLEGLVIDMRMNETPDIAILQGLLSLFVGGELGSFVSLRGNNTTPTLYMANPVTDVSGSLDLPLVVIQDQTTGEAALFGGLLQLLGRARIVGQTANGGAYLQYVDGFSDGSALYLANLAFQPRGEEAGYWDKTGVKPDVSVSGRWEQFSEANDPYLAKAVELLVKK